MKKALIILLVLIPVICFGQDTIPIWIASPSDSFHFFVLWDTTGADSSRGYDVILAIYPPYYWSDTTMRNKAWATFTDDTISPIDPWITDGQGRWIRRSFWGISAPNLGTDSMVAEPFPISWTEPYEPSWYEKLKPSTLATVTIMLFILTVAIIARIKLRSESED